CCFAMPHIQHYSTFTLCLFVITLHPVSSTLSPYTTLFRSRKRSPLGRAPLRRGGGVRLSGGHREGGSGAFSRRGALACTGHHRRSEEHTSELQSRENLVCRLLLEKKKLTLCNPIDLLEISR